MSLNLSIYSKPNLYVSKDWETDYEKRVALLGFLAAPEGKRAFGALHELAKAHQEQIKMQEEQARLRQVCPITSHPSYSPMGYYRSYLALVN